MDILERDSHLAILHDLAQEAASGRGRLVFLGAESGGGKTTLVERFAQSIGERAPATIVSCDGLKMPGPYGPLFDIASALGPDVEQVLREHAPRERIFRSVLDALQAAPGLNVMVGEDAHWVDEATLELIRFLGRRIASTHTLLIVTYREDGLDTYHPLRRVLGDLVNEPAVSRIWLPAFSVEAVASLAATTGIDPASLHARTNGNPFFVTEILAAGGSDIPSTIRDAVLGRAAAMSPEARAALDAAAMIGMIFDPDLLECVIGASVTSAVEEGLAVGMFRSRGDRISFRHGLTRDVFQNALSPPRRRDLHRRILRILEEEPRFEADAALLADHAEGAYDLEATVRYATQAAREAATFGAHRQAAAQYGRVLAAARTVDPETRAALLSARAYECYLTGESDAAIALQQEAVAIRRDLGDAPTLANSLCWLSRFSWFAGNSADAERYVQDALATLEGVPPGPVLAKAWSSLSQIRMLNNDIPAALHWGGQAIALAEELDHQPILTHALTNVGTALMNQPGADGRALLDRAIRIAIEQHLPDDAARAMTNLAWPMLDRIELDTAEPMLEAAIAYTSEHDLLGMELYQRAALTRLWLARGSWDLAASTNERLLGMASANSHTRIVALTVLGQVETRRGNDATPLLDQALALAVQTGHLMRLGPVRAARAEAAWLTGDPELAVAETHTGYERAIACQDAWNAGILALWLHRCGETGLDTAALPAPYALEITGRGREAAAFWRERRMPLEEARALASTGEEEALLEALTLVDRLGARPDAARIVRGLRQIGTTSIPRGPRAETRANPAGLTSREVEVLELLVRGCTNREIADSLYLSPRTVGHHVSAILGKLDITSRADAAARAADLDLLAG